MNEYDYDEDSLRRGITAMEKDIERFQDGIKEITKRIDIYKFYLTQVKLKSSNKNGDKK